MRSLTCCAALGVLLCCVATRGAPPRSDVERVSLATSSVVIPMDHTTGHVAVQVMLDGQGPFRFQVDTYASIGACLDDDVAAALELPVTGRTLNSDGRTTRQKDLVTIGTLVLGGATFEGVTTLVDDYDWIAGDGGRRVDGLLGFRLFSELLLTFDYPGSRLVLSRESLAADDPEALPFRTPSGSPDITLRVDDVELEVGIDTGHGGTLMLPREDAERLPLAGALRKVGEGRTVYSSFDILEARLSRPLALASHRLVDQPLSFVEGISLGLLGHGILSRYEVSFDQRRGVVRFHAPGTPGAGAR